MHISKIISTFAAQNKNQYTMRKLFLLISVITVSLTASAAVVTPERAMQVAQSFVPVQKIPKKNAKGVADTPTSEIVYTHYMPKSGRPAIYVVNVGNGFAIVSADDVAHPVLGYNYSKSWPTDGNIPPQVKSFFDDLAAQIEAASEHPQDAETAAEWQNPKQRKAARLTQSNLPDSVGPLLTTTWDQGQYYNAMCPEDGQAPEGYDGHCPTGCVATAMAQIIKYWGDREAIHTRGIHSYDCYDSQWVAHYGILAVNYDSTSYDFAHMPNALTSVSSPQEVYAVAKLIYECGVAVNMHYGATASGTTGMITRAAFVNNYMFNSNTSYVCRKGYKNTDWEQILRNQLAIHQPIIYNGIDTILQVGHSFVCDGYKQDGYFHFNFGWSGNGDGWFQLSSVNPGIYNFDYSHSAIVNIAPSNDNSILYDQMDGKSTFAVNSPITIYNGLSNSTYRGNIDDWYPGADTLVFYSPSGDSEIEFSINTLPVTSNWITDIHVYDGENADSLLRKISSYDNNGLNPSDLSPIVSTKGALSIYVNGVANYDGYSFEIYPYNGCTRVTDVNVTTDETTAIVSWKNNGDANAWQIEYGVTGFTRGTGTILNISDTVVTISGLEPLTQYDVYVRSVCGNDLYGRWSHKVTFKSSGKLWIDQVSTEPAGYIVDEKGDVTISTKEGLAWFAKQVNVYFNYFYRQTIHLMSDVDMSGFVWTPINFFQGSFEGHGHSISNLYIETGGMFGEINGACEINDLHLRNLYVSAKSYNQSGAGGLVGIHYGIGRDNRLLIKNCSSTGIILGGQGTSYVGGLVGSMNTGDIINCWSSCNIRNSEYSAGGICGHAYKDSHVYNCYFRGNATARISIGGVTGWTEYCDVEKCYAYSDNFDGWVPVAYGGMGTTYKDLALFTREDTTLQLLSAIAFEKDTTDILIKALNNGVIELNDNDMRTWIIDPITEMPCLGDYYEVSCPNITNLTSRNIVNETNEIGVVLSWHEVGTSTQWQIYYQEMVENDDEIENRDIDKNVLICTCNPDTIWGLKIGTNYEFCVRSSCDSEHQSGWGEKINLIVDKPYWTEVITSQPEGYSIDQDGNISISSAEGLAWLISVANGLNGEQGTTFVDKRISITEDINIKQYKWTPINGFAGTFDGRNHIICNLYVNELTTHGGLFGLVNGGHISNIILDSVSIRCAEHAGGLTGEVQNSTIQNCHIFGDIYAELNVGGISGHASDCYVEGCSFIGNTSAKHHYAGGLFGDMIGLSSIRNSYTSCNVFINGYGAGGLVGSCYSGIIENSYSVVAVSGFDFTACLLGNYRNISGISKTRNCYAKISGNSIVRGLIIGATDGEVNISHCYGPEHNSFIPFIGPAEYTYDNGYPIITDTASYQVDGENITLLNNVYINENIYTNLLSALNAWVDDNNEEGKYRHWVADTENINGGFPIFDPNDSPSTGIDNTNVNTNVNAVKILRDGQIFILRGEKIYNAQGALVSDK